ncbi:MAG: hypothetical protein ACRDD2_13725 [Sarcina sp.]
MKKGLIGILVIVMGMTLVSCNGVVEKKEQGNKDTTTAVAEDNKTANNKENIVTLDINDKNSVNKLNNTKVDNSEKENKETNKKENSNDENKVENNKEITKEETIKNIEKTLNDLDYTKEVNGTVEFQGNQVTSSIIENLENDYYVFYINSGTGEEAITLENAYAVNKKTKEIFVIRVDGQFMKYKDFQKWNEEVKNQLNSFFKAENIAMNLTYTKNNNYYVMKNDNLNEKYKNYYCFDLYKEGENGLENINISYLVEKNNGEVKVSIKGNSPISYSEFIKGENL